MSTHVNTAVDLSIRINGNAVATYSHEGKSFIEAKEGSQYHLHVKNPHPHRIKVVLSVDGINIVNGEPASGAPEEAGYILESYESQTFKGYRLSDTEVAAFKFTKAEGGYAQAEKGLKGTTGVIGCKVWKEKIVALAPQTIIKEIHHHNHWCDWNYWYRPYWDTYVTWCGATAQASATTNAGCCYGTIANNANSMTFACANGSNDIHATAMNACAVAPQGEVAQASLGSNPFDAGSTWGEKVESLVKSVAFEVGECTGEVSIYYAFRAGLAALGIDLTKIAKVVFPAAFSGKFATPPRGWVG